MEEEKRFEEGQAYLRPDKSDQFIVELEGFEGPADVLLTLARDQKVDITQISILDLANQYLSFIDRIGKLNLELAADYLVMASWLAYLKSRLLLPELDEVDEPSGVEMAAALRYQLQRLESMQKFGQKLLDGKRLGIDFFPRGKPEYFRTQIRTFYELSLNDLLQAYGEQRQRKLGMKALKITSFEIYSVEQSLDRLRRLLEKVKDWRNLWNFLPKGITGNLLVRSAVASTFAATLELSKEGKMELRQTLPFGPIHIRTKKV